MLNDPPHLGQAFRAFERLGAGVGPHRAERGRGSELRRAPCRPHHHRREDQTVEGDSGKVTTGHRATYIIKREATAIAIMMTKMINCPAITAPPGRSIAACRLRNVAADGPAPPSLDSASPSPVL